MMLRSSENSEKSKSKTISPHSLSLNDEDGYFASYTHHDIHMTMLKVNSIKVSVNLQSEKVSE